MNLWVDTIAATQSSLQAPNQWTSPAAQDQPVLQEFLASRQFLVNVGRRGPLAAMLTGHQNGKSPAVQNAVDNEVAVLLAHAFTVSIVGPNLVGVTMTGASPAYLPGTLNAVAAEFVAEVDANIQAHSSASAAVFQAQLNDAEKQLNQDMAAAAAYRNGHPGASTQTDNQYSQMADAVQNDQKNITQLQGNVGQAASGLSTLSAHVSDPPVGAVELSNKKHKIFTIVAGLAAGLIISILALSALTALDKTARREEDIDGVAGMEVVGSIRELPRRPRLPALGKAKP
jgi:hypothetical protein